MARFAVRLFTTREEKMSNSPIRVRVVPDDVPISILTLINEERNERLQALEQRRPPWWMNLLIYFWFDPEDGRREDQEITAERLKKHVRRWTFAAICLGLAWFDLLAEWACLLVMPGVLLAMYHHIVGAPRAQKRKKPTFKHFFGICLATFLQPAIALTLGVAAIARRVFHRLTGATPPEPIYDPRAWKRAETEVYTEIPWEEIEERAVKAWNEKCSASCGAFSVEQEALAVRVDQLGTEHSKFLLLQYPAPPTPEQREYVNTQIGFLTERREAIIAQMERLSEKRRRVRERSERELMALKRSFCVWASQKDFEQCSVLTSELEVDLESFERRFDAFAESIQPTVATLAVEMHLLDKLHLPVPFVRRRVVFFHEELEDLAERAETSSLAISFVRRDST